MRSKYMEIRFIVLDDRGERSAPNSYSKVIKKKAFDYFKTIYVFYFNKKPIELYNPTDFTYINILIFIL